MFLFLRYRFIGGPSSFTQRFTVLKDEETEKSEREREEKRLVTVASRMNFFLGSIERKKQEGGHESYESVPLLQDLFYPRKTIIQ